MPTATSRILVTVSLAVFVATLLVPFDSEARRVRVRTHTSSHDQQKTNKTDSDAAPTVHLRSNNTNSQPAQPSQEELQRQAEARERARQQQAEWREKYEAQRREQQEKWKQNREARMQAQRDNTGAKQAQEPAAVAETKVAMAKPAAKPAKLTGYRDSKGVMTFSDGTDTPR